MNKKINDFKLCVDHPCYILDKILKINCDEHKCEIYGKFFKLYIKNNEQYEETMTGIFYIDYSVMSGISKYIINKYSLSNINKKYIFREL